MLKLNENKTLKELSDKGFYICAYSCYYPVNKIIDVVFSLNKMMDDYLCYVGCEYRALVEPNQYENEIKKVLNELKEEGFIVNVKD